MDYLYIRKLNMYIKLLTILLIIPSIVGQVTVQLSETYLFVTEGEQFSLKVIKTGAITEDLVVVVSVVQGDVEDFVGDTQVGTFTRGMNEVTVTFTVRDDDIAEDDEGFQLQLSVVGNKANVANPFVASIVIQANDDAFGVFKFLDTGPIIVEEQSYNSTTFDLRIGRSRGTFGTVTLTFQTTGKTSNAIAGSDLAPIRGQITFPEKVTTAIMHLQVRADNIPENTESFIVKLTGASSGARIEGGEIEIRILANDAPISFEKGEYRYEEGPGIKTAHVVLLRGIEGENPIPIGPIDTQVSAEVILVSGTAILGQDFNGESKKVVFPPGVMRTNFTFQILDDLVPEMEEMFKIQIGKLDGGVIWGKLIEVVIKISANDNPNGAISFESINAANSLVVRVNEDTFTVATFPVIRNGGLFGAVAVEWDVVRFGDSTVPVLTDVGPLKGTITFAAGQRDTEISLTIVQDVSSEVAEKFLIRLKPDTVVGNAKIEGIIQAELIIEDSDNVYGTVEFGPDNTHLIPTKSGSRYLQLQLDRNDGRVDDLLVNITVVFNDVDGQLTADDMLLTPEIQVTMPTDKTPVTVEIPLLPTAFLQIGGNFVATLSDVRLQTEPAFGAYNSPKLGSRKSVTMEIRSEEANGKIGFFNMTDEIVEEPSAGLLEIPLIISREGKSGDAVIRWSIKGIGESVGQVTQEDVVALSGSVSIPSGSNTVGLSIEIRPDNIPENNETMVVTLDSVEPTATQRLHQATRSVTITILENDNPGGVFQFAGAMRNSYLISEGDEAIEVIVERTGGNLMKKEVQYVIEPDGVKEFFGAINVLRFQPGETRKTATVIAKSDNIPELGETYTMRLTSYGETEATIGDKNTILITVKENDQPYGVVQFTNNPMVIYIRESRGSNTENASLPIERIKGSFGTVTVSWTLLPSTGDDLRPTFGILTMRPGETTASIDIASVDDDISEQDETIRVQLSTPTGGATLGQPDSATVIIRSNDNPVEFIQNQVYSEEPASLVFTVIRKGNLAESATVRYRTLDGPAKSSDGDFSPILGKIITFQPGQSMFNLTVSVLDDDVPEGNETFVLQLFDLGGDLLLTDRSTATITILDNDNAYGIFKFESSTGRTIEEGSEYFLNIDRSEGREGSVEVFWRIRSLATGNILNNEDQFELTQGSVIFQSQERKQQLSIKPLADDIPETNLAYTVELYNLKVLVGRIDTDSLANLARTDTSVLLNVVASDDPNGRFAFPSNARELQIAEDFEVGKDSTTRTTVTVERRQGVLGKTEVIWEIYSDSVGGTFPDLVDLMFIGDRPPSMVPIPTKQRNQTGTLVLFFSGAPGNYVTVSNDKAPDVSKFENGLTLSAWVQPFPNANGYIIARASASGVRQFYSLKLLSTSSTVNIDLTLSTTESENQAISSSSNKNIQDGKWHHILVTVSNISIVFYLDGISIGTSKMEGNRILDSPDGVLLVGARAPGGERYNGYLQDVRLFKRRLEENEIRETYDLPAKREVTPVSGILVFEQNVKSNTFEVRSLQDVEEEGNEVFSIDLLTSNGGATISSVDGKATLTVLKSDNANGEFRYKDLCTPASTSLENAAITCSVERLRGDDGTVYLTWVVRQVTPTGTVDAVEDFVNYTGVVTFPPGSRLQTFQFEVKEDNLPEVKKTFMVMLEKVVSDDGVIGTTNTSGASISASGRLSQIIIEENDYPYGLLQFSGLLTPPVSMGTMILPTESEPEIMIQEEIGVATLVVVRAQGTLKKITAEWRTEDGSAKSQGKSPIDFEGDASVITFEEGETWTFVNISILDNVIPEDAKYFYVNLVNPQSGAAIGIGGRLKVTIRPSDGAFGIYRFSDSALQIIADEEGDLGFNSVFFEVVRLGGAIGKSNVTWITEGDVNNDLVDRSGVITFESGQITSRIEIKIRGDIEPELDEIFRITLTGTSEGELGDKLKRSSLLIVKANDDPYGVFVVADQSRSIREDEKNSDVTIEAQRLKGRFGGVSLTYSTLAPTQTYPFLPGPLTRADVTDFRAVTKTVQFLPNEEFKNFTVTIFDDSLPEEDESVFVQLIEVTVTQVAQVSTISKSPRLGENFQTYSQIIINSNDDAGGVLELFPLAVNVTEGSQPEVSLRRLGGLFGEVTVLFRAIQGSALSKVDYEVLRTEVILNSGEASKKLPIEILDDRIPELMESFTLELISVSSGGATLGTNKQAVVNILPSDDPYGLFRFAMTSQSVEEPENGLPYTIEIRVERLGGSMGIVNLEWMSDLNGEEAVQDIQPSSGTLRFVSGESNLKISIQILPDDIPEGQEDITLSIKLKSTEGRIDEQNTFTLTIAPNDNPHGFVQLYTNEYRVKEKLNEVVRVQRSGGTYGSLKVFYTVSEIDLVSEAIRRGEAVIGYYDSGTSGKRGDTGNQVDITSSTESLLSCASVCLSIEACLSFQFSRGSNSTTCHWFTTTTNKLTIIQDTSSTIYDKNSERYEMLQAAKARVDVDFGLVTENYILIGDGETSGAINMSIIDDNLPELDEKFELKLTKVEVADEKFKTKENPKLGEIKSALVVIETNDNANGVFNIYGTPASRGRIVEVEEIDKYAVDLVVERQGGNIGDVNIQWSVDTGNATYGTDYIADGAILSFANGITRRVITVTILDDTIPEDREEFIIYLNNIDGVAELGTETNISIVILENDYVAGLMALESTSVLASEGDKLSVNITRTPPAHGTVKIDWSIKGKGGLKPDLGFKISFGSVIFQPGETSKRLELEVLKDETPEINEEYELQLMSVETQGVGTTGAASIDPQFKTALITIQGSDNPHGIIQIASASLTVRIEEDIGQVRINIDRKFGAIGVVRVNYEVLSGSIASSNTALSAATVNDDFRSTASFIDIADAVTSGQIVVDIINDERPEIDEVFKVKLLSVALVGSLNTEPPRLATNNTEAEVVINANDGAKGIIIFASDSRSVKVDERTNNISLTVQRTAGTFGDVSVFYMSQSFQEGSTLGADYKVTPRQLIFLNGERTRTILIEILDDDIPEPDEQFEVILTNPGNKVEIGTSSTATITILANDGATGIVSFDSAADVTLVEPSADNSSGSKAEIRVVRGPGIFGVVKVPYIITPGTGGTKDDLSVMNGVLTFQDKQTTAILEISALADTIPELSETFTIELLKPDNLAELGAIKQIKLIIQANDAPQGLFEISLANTGDSTLSVEENTQGFISFDIKRTRGLLGRVTVDVETEPQTASSSPDPREITVAHYQELMGVNVSSWFSYQHKDVTYVLMLTSLTSDQQLKSLIPEANGFESGQSVVWRWQGELIYFQTIPTNGATAATWFINNDKSYVIVANSGKEGARETKSSLFIVQDDGKLLSLQQFNTKGASDVEYFMYNSQKLLVFTNSLDDSSSSILTSDMYIWDNTNLRFNTNPIQAISSMYARSAATQLIDGNLFLFTSNYYDSTQNSHQTRSLIMKMSTDLRFYEHQRLSTEGAIDGVFIDVGSLTLLVIGNNRQNTITSPQISQVYRWDSSIQTFLLHQDIQTRRVEKISLFKASDGAVFLVFANDIGNSEMFIWNSETSKFSSVWTGPASQYLYPIIINQKSSQLILLAGTPVIQQQKATVYEVARITKDSDYVPRKITLIFEENQTTMRTTAVVLQDDNPEDTETFAVKLSNPTGGAVLGPQSSVVISILSNDDAHGIIEFSQESLLVRATEQPNRDSSVQFTLERKLGIYGRVVVKWSTSGDNDGENDIAPTSGNVVFGNGVSIATITLTIRDDSISEFDETTFIKLDEIIETGTNLDSRGAKIGENNVATLIIQANDSPYGVVSWEKSLQSVTEPEGTDAAVTVAMIREQGTTGSIRISFVTSMAVALDSRNQATSGEDYVSRLGKVTMEEGVTRATVDITIKHDDIPEADERFLINITDAELLGGSANSDSKPSIKIPGNVMEIRIPENDNARGLVEFDVETNIEGRIDLYEEFGKNNTFSLKLKRSVGVVGTVTVTWEADPKEATILDYFPSSGTIRFEDGQTEAVLQITILDDTIPEDLEMFEVRLIAINGGASIGATRSVIVAILKNDSPNGLFLFTTPEVEMKESKVDNDPEGQATLRVGRQQGSEGLVVVKWQLNAEAASDFMEPHGGEIQFTDGETVKAILLKSKPDNIREGREEFTVSLISATNNGDISPTLGDATVVILPDSGASGTISIKPDSQTVYIGEKGESSPGYDGKVEIVLTRGDGIFGEVSVTWSISPKETQAFQQLEGSVKFVDRQQEAKIIIQSKDDQIPELRKIYTLQINSASGGATISTDQSELSSNIIFVASDYPHGIFQFSQPAVTTVTEDTGMIEIPVLRTNGDNGRVQIAYTTSQGTALESEDYFPTAGTLMFENGVRSQSISVNIRPDNDPEGPETFYINITSVLLSPSNNDYSIRNGLQLDMEPVAGLNNVMSVVIEKNDDAEGKLEFAPEALNFEVEEESGMARIPVIRVGGDHGRVSILYRTLNETATIGSDYIGSAGEVYFDSGIMRNTINITIRDDTEMEFEEKFKVILTGVTGGAKLGSNTQSTVTILKSDYPNGKFGFLGQSEIILANPERDTSQMLAIERTAGLLGQQQVYWRIMGPNNPSLVLEDSSDISVNFNNIQTTSGSLVWQDGQSGSKQFQVDVKAYSSWEIQKKYIIEIYRVTGAPSSVGNGEISKDSGKVSLTIEKFGDPNGVVRFDTAAQIARDVEEPDGKSTDVLKLTFPVKRREGTGIVGTIKINWVVEGPEDSESDVRPLNGSLLLSNEKRSGDIVLDILADDVPELTESFTLKLESVEGGAELDKVFTSSVFRIRYNDNPHGLFGVVPGNQAVTVDPLDLSRHVSLNFTRDAGSFGSVVLTYTLKYDKQQAGVILSKNTGTVTFDEGTAWKTQVIDIDGNGFLEMGSTFTLVLVEVRFIGEVTIEPELLPGQTQVKIPVPEEAANTKIGFEEIIVSVDEETDIAVLNVTRQGTYGSLTIDWEGGYQTNSLPSGVQNGIITPSTGALSIPHGDSFKTFSVQLRPNLGVVEMFVMRLPRPPVVTVSGGGQLMAGMTEAKIEPSGVIRFSKDSIEPSVSELDGKVIMKVDRVYGSEGKLEVMYNTQENTAQEGVDYKPPNVGIITLDPRVVSAQFEIEIVQDTQAERDEDFFVNLTSVIKFPTTPEIQKSPRLSSVYSNSVVTVKQSNDPYGILSLRPLSTTVEEKYQDVTLRIERSGGLYGSVGVRVRTIGGGEAWTTQIIERPGPDNNTIANILGNRDKTRTARNGRDYQAIDKTFDFLPNEEVKEFQLTIFDDEQAEAAETVLVYLTDPLGGATIAQGSQHGGRTGFSIITIEESDLFNGVIGFAPESMTITANEDTNPNIQFRLARLKVSELFNEVTVSWRAKVSKTSDEAMDSTLATQLDQLANTITCPPNKASCTFTVPLKNDQIPEEAFSFIVVLTDVSNGATLDNSSLISTVTVQPSDDIRGVIQFTESSRLVVVSEEDRDVTLKVERTQGKGYLIQVGYETRQQNTQTTESNIIIFPALDGQDFSGESGTLQFLPSSSEVGSISLILTPVLSSDNPLPKQFNVYLKLPSNGARLNPEYSQATVRIVSKDEIFIWKAVSGEQAGPLTDANILTLLGSLDNVAQGDVSENEMKLIESSLRKILDEGEKRRLPPQVDRPMMNLFCKLLDSEKEDATKGRHSLTKLFEDFAYILVTDTPCPASGLETRQCSSAVISGGRWTADQIENYEYKAQRQDSFLIADGFLPPTSSVEQKCEDFHMIEYNSIQWFKEENQPELLNNRVISFGVKGRDSQSIDNPVKFRIHTPDRRIATKRAECAYYDEATRKWSGQTDVCSVTNNLEIAVDSYVDCSCNHMTSYAVIGKTYEEGIVGYVIWFYIACFICMTCLAIVILSHHVCSVHPMFAASLLMHMCFAAMMTQICIVVSAYLSPTDILVPSLTENNYKCIVMGLFLHYFFICQFSWIMTQSLNFWKLLVLNDEHTQRKYVGYFILGWGVPMIIVAIFYAVVYNVYKYIYNLPYDFIYGDVNNNGEMCFITNPYSALGGVIIPVLLMLLVVAIVFVKAFQLTPQWQSYDDIYRGRYNLTEVRLIIMFWIVICLTWLWGGLHMVYGQLWMLILFCIFNIIQGLMALVLYAILRNPCVTCLGPSKKAMYGSNHFASLPPPSALNYGYQGDEYDTAPTMKNSRANLLNESWEKDSVGPRSQMTVKRALPTQVYINPPIAVINPPSHRQDVDDKDFEDLLHALKTGGSLTPSELSRSIDSTSTLSVRLDNFETKRINIADTHL